MASTVTKKISSFSPMRSMCTFVGNKTLRQISSTEERTNDNREKMRLRCRSTESSNPGRTRGRQSLPLLRRASKKPEIRLRRHSECHTPSQQLGVARRRRTSVRNLSSVASCLPSQKAKLNQSPQHSSDMEFKSDWPLQPNFGSEDENKDPLEITPVKDTLPSTRDKNIALQLSEHLVRDLLLTPENQRRSIGSDGEYDKKCDSIKKQLFGGSPLCDFRVPRVVRTNSNKKQPPANEKSPTISQQGSFSYDSDMEMLSDVGKPGFESPKFRFEPIETINEYPNINRSMGNNEVITGILESCVVDQNRKNRLDYIMEKPDVTVKRRKIGRPRKDQRDTVKTPVRKSTRVRKNAQCTGDIENYSSCGTSNRRRIPLRKSAQVAQEKIQDKLEDNDNDTGDDGTHNRQRWTREKTPARKSAQVAYEKIKSSFSDGDNNDNESRSSRSSDRAKTPAKTSQFTSGKNDGTCSRRRPSNREKTPARTSAAIAPKNSQCPSDDEGISNNCRPKNRAPKRKNLKIQSLASNKFMKDDSSDDIQPIIDEKMETNLDSNASDSDSASILSETDPIYIDIEAEVADRVIDYKIVDEMSRLRVIPDTDVAPQHLLESTLSYRPKVDTRRTFVKYAPLKRGHFTTEESEIVRSNWHRFCEVHDWDPACTAPFLQLKFRGKLLMPHQTDRLNFVRYLVKGLPSRTLFSALMHFRTIFRAKQSSSKLRRFSSIEDKKILAYLTDGADSDRCRKLSRVLKRCQYSIYKRLKVLQEKAKKNAPTGRIEWDLEMAQKYLTNLMELTLTTNIRDLEDEFIPKIVWVELEKRMKIPYKNLRNFWCHQLHLQLYCPWPIYQNDMKIMIIEYLYVKGITHREELDFLEIAKHIPGATSEYLCDIYWRLIKVSPFKNTSCAADIGDMVEWLYTTKIPAIIESPTDRLLPRLRYENGNLVLLDVIDTTT